MIYKNEKISLQQSLLLLATLLGMPTIRLASSYTAQIAKQAAWLSPLISLGLSFIYVLIFNRIFMKNEEKSLVEISNEILGKVVGNTVSGIILIWITILTALYVRYFAERILSTILPNVSIILLIATMVGFVAYFLNSGIVVLARMNEIIVFFIIIIFALCNILILPEINVRNLYPITYKDIIPIFKGSLVPTGLWSYLTFIFMFGDIINKKDFKKTSSIIMILITILTILAIIIPIGTFGWSLTSKMSLSYSVAVREISLFNFIERIDAILVAMWILCDIVLIAVFSFIALHMIKKIFKPSDTKPFIGVFTLLIFFLSLLLCRNVFELQDFSKYIGIPVNIILGCGVPLIIFIVGKIRKKI